MIPVSEYILQLPEDENVVLSGPAVQRLLTARSGDAALLYIWILKNKGRIEDKKTIAELKWTGDQFQRAISVLAAQDLIQLPDGEKTISSSKSEPIQPPPEDRRPEYTRADMARALEGQEFSALTKAVEDKLGKPLTTPDVAILLGLYDQLGFSPDVIYLLVSFCVEQGLQRYGKGRKPNMRQIEKEGYIWYRLGLMDQESAAAYIKKRQKQQEALPRMMRLLRLDDRKPSLTEEKYLLSWIDMGFEDGAIEQAYDKTVIQCKELRWPYMNKILESWHKAGLHTLSQIELGDKPRKTAKSQQSGTVAAQDEMARLEKYREQLRREMEGS